MKLIILGGGLSALSLAYFLQESEEIESITILEKEERAGGLCRSIHKAGYTYDIGPHILFSKDKEMLDLMLGMLSKKNKLRRSNQILYKGRYVQYPFENDLSKLPKEDLNYCVTSFLHNPYEGYEPQNMLQFFLKTFGEGITNTYLRPYNEKIWKFDPSFMDTQMVERIPKPTDEELMRSAEGETVDGYVHQLYFSYPAEGGIESVVKGFSDHLNEKCQILLNRKITCAVKTEDGYMITSDQENYRGDLVVSTIPVQELAAVYESDTELKPDSKEKSAAVQMKKAVGNLKYNSIAIALVRTIEDLSGDNFAFMVPDKDIIFHRISKMDFLGASYRRGGAAYMVEVTYREYDQTDRMSMEELAGRILEGITKIGFSASPQEAEIINITKHPYAYVIYDLHHRKNMEVIRDYFENRRILLHGRFGNFEYWNMDRILRESKRLAERILGTEE